MAEQPQTTSAGGDTKEHALIPFLRAQSQGALTRLYTRPSACLAVFRWVRVEEDQLKALLTRLHRKRYYERM